jgi:hypothetical protein
MGGLFKLAYLSCCLFKLFLIQNSRQAHPAVVLTSFAYDGAAFIQTDLSEAVLDFVGAIIRRIRHFLYSGG